jgi:F420H(2)-dependent quinone reductase
VRARAAASAERERLWARFADFPGWGDDIDALATRRSTETAVVVFEPRPAGVAVIQTNAAESRSS